MNFVLPELNSPGVDVLGALRLCIEGPQLSIFLSESAPQSHLGTLTEPALPVLNTWQ